MKMETREIAAPPEREHGQALLRQMRRIRRFEERAAELYQAGKIRGFLHLYIGEEDGAAPPDIAPEEQEVLHWYRQTDDRGRRIIREVAEGAYDTREPPDEYTGTAG